MALKATIFKADLHISNLDTNYYAQHSLTIARHPSETDERMMVRVLTFALFAHENLQLTKGLSTDEEPDLWQKDLTGQIQLWIDLGTPDEKRLRKAAGRSDQVVVVAYGGNAPTVWWKKNADAFSAIKNLTVIAISKENSEALSALAQRSLQLQCTIQDGNLWLGNEVDNIHIEPHYWLTQ